MIRRSRGFTGTRPRIIEEIKSRIEIPNTASGQVLLRDIPHHFSPVITNEATPRSLQQVDGDPQADRDESSGPRTETSASFWNNWSFKIDLSGISQKYRGGGPHGSLSVTTSEILSGFAVTQRRFSSTATTSTTDSTEAAVTAQTSSTSSSRWSTLTDAIGEAMGPPLWMKDKGLDGPFVQRVMLLDSTAMVAAVYGT
ncbi:hypothetical protein FOIG_14766 [Fusarium odoratissimum NRRL 54006]|uniref:Uncharacterized protein n=2 Tax=Fusarium oxysporum species complex TaxID=171631 RepID=X0IT96_FUSO5|nr:uncharacterized protein FOIG_14766 [Fusarium odoratissimum NRRL 54006]EXL92102.1 hypothetical protein FOIG_14766 [Fusarium odoratissimum NRRL 54006]TXC02107.1 hypothetical protein FocTR4_00014851 [Fusarium oxysporum f. sp. cubense]